MLMSICKFSNYDSLLTNDIEHLAVVNVDSVKNVELRHPNIEVNLQLDHALLIDEYENELHDYPVHPCVSCDCLFSHSNVSTVKLTDKIGDTLWTVLKKHIV